MDKMTEEKKPISPLKIIAIIFVIFAVLISFMLSQYFLTREVTDYSLEDYDCEELEQSLLAGSPVWSSTTESIFFLKKINASRYRYDQYEVFISYKLRCNGD